MIGSGLTWNGVVQACNPNLDPPHVKVGSESFLYGSAFQALSRICSAQQWNMHAALYIPGFCMLYAEMVGADLAMQKVQLEAAPCMFQRHCDCTCAGHKVALAAVLAMVSCAFAGSGAHQASHVVSYNDKQLQVQLIPMWPCI